MRKMKSIAVVCGLLIVVAIGFYFIGYKAAYDRFEGMERSSLEQTFYAAITNIDGSNFEVQGLAVNDINYRGAFTFTVSAETKMEWRGTELSVADFNTGDTISIMYSGEIQETYPAYIVDVVMIQLLDDEK